jgi:HAMP domain-containing protein
VLSPSRAGAGGQEPRALIRSLRTRLLLLVAIAVLPALAMIVYAGVENRRLAARAAQERALHLANLAALQQNQIVEATRQLLAGLAQLPAVRGLAPGPCSALMAEVQKQFPSYANMGAIRPDGELVCSAVPLPGPLNVADRSYFRRALETREFAVSEFLIGRVTQKPSLTFAYPALDRRREVEAVLFAAVDLRWLNHLAADALLPRGSTLTVVDQEGRVLARHPQGEAWIGKVVAGMPMVQAILTGRPEGTGEAAGLDGVPRLYGFARLPLPPGAGRLYIAVAIPTSEALAAANRALGAHLGGFAVVALLALAAALVGGHRLVVRPAVAVTAAASRVAAGDVGARTGLPHDEGELGQLARAFDEMAGALERRTGELRNAEARTGRSWSRPSPACTCSPPTASSTSTAPAPPSSATRSARSSAASSPPTSSTPRTGRSWPGISRPASAAPRKPRGTSSAAAGRTARPCTARCSAGASCWTAARWSSASSSTSPSGRKPRPSCGA